MFSTEVKSVGQEILDAGWTIGICQEKDKSYLAWTENGYGTKLLKEKTAYGSTPKQALDALAAKMMEGKKNESTE